MYLVIEQEYVGPENSKHFRKDKFVSIWREEDWVYPYTDFREIDEYSYIIKGKFETEQQAERYINNKYYNYIYDDYTDSYKDIKDYLFPKATENYIREFLIENGMFSLVGLFEEDSVNSVNLRLIKMVAEDLCDVIEDEENTVLDYDTVEQFLKDMVTFIEKHGDTRGF